MTHTKNELEVTKAFVKLLLDQSFDKYEAIKVGVGDIARMTERVTKLQTKATGKYVDVGFENQIIVDLAREYGLV